MMRKSLIAMIATMLFGVSAANASVYKFTFESSDAELTASGQITANTAGEVTGVSGVISGLADQTISAVAGNPSFPGAAYSADDLFIYDNQFHASGMPFDLDGLLFVTTQNPGGFWNLWGNSPGNYSLFESAGGGYPVQESGTLSVAAAPEPSTWTMLALGLASLGLVGRRRRTERLAPAFG
ncbi:MAG TPA: PEP-CTERM sorting domain-containing protein [Roseiarcus sp.]|nr:PEP-CTERM sorting domain-containing protein [Roseiarcus sp.]